MTIKHRKASTAGASTDPAKVGGDDWNDDHQVDAGGINLPASTAAPVAPPDGTLALYAQNIASDPLPAYITSNGSTNVLQPFLGRGNVIAWIPGWASSSLTVLGQQVNSSGTTYIRTITAGTTSRFLMMPRLGYGSPTAAGSYARIYTVASWARGTTAMRMVARWGCSDPATVASAARSFVGLAQTLGTANPSTMLNLVGVGTDSGDTTLSLFYNDATGAATKVSLGANFPDHTLSVDVYELAMACPASGAYMDVEVTRLNTGDVFRTRLTTDLPSTTSGTSAYFLRCNGTATLEVRFDFFSFYLETGN
jgi:hypothetical protein